MALTERGYPPSRIETTARVAVEMVPEAFWIPSVELYTDAVVPGIDAETFLGEAEKAKVGCPVPKALGGTETRLEAHLKP